MYLRFVHGLPVFQLMLLSSPLFLFLSDRTIVSAHPQPHFYMLLAGWPSLVSRARYEEKGFFCAPAYPPARLAVDPPTSSQARQTKVHIFFGEQEAAVFGHQLHGTFVIVRPSAAELFTFCQPLFF